MGVKNFPLYKVTEHARERILTRFNITKTEFDGWMSRLLSQGEFVERQSNNREKYRLHDIVFIIDTQQKHLITVYSENPPLLHSHYVIQHHWRCCNTV